MNLLNILPAINGIKTIVAAYTQIILGLLLSLVQLVQLFADCLNGITALDACVENLPLAVTGVVVAANGLGQLGIGHKIEKASNQ